MDPAPESPFALHGPSVELTARVLLGTMLRILIGSWVIWLATRSPLALSGAAHLTLAYALMYARIPD
jgi:hypothetical protein